MKTVKVLELIPRSNASFVIQIQVFRSAFAIGANYRSLLRGRSKAEFISRLGIVVEEADESNHWFEIIKSTN